jgi:hypothetical protein
MRHRTLQCCLLTAALATAGGGASAQTPAAPVSPAGSEAPSIRLSPENLRFNNYLQDLAGPGAFIGIVGGGLVDHLRADSRPNDGSDDLTSRIVARAGQAAVQASVRHGLAALMNRSTEYQPCECRGIGPKIEHALLETFTDRRLDGSRALSVPRLAGAYAGGFSRLAWDNDRSAGDVALGTTLSFGLTAVFNVARELIAPVR